MVTLVNGHLVITPLPREPLLDNIMRKTEHLSDEAQQQLMHIINGLTVQESKTGYAGRSKV